MKKNKNIKKNQTKLKKGNNLFPEPVYPSGALERNEPPKEYNVHHYDVTKPIAQCFISLVEKNAGEKEIDIYLKKHPQLFAVLLGHYNTGHHNSWVIPQKTIKNKIVPDDKGLIPDYIIGGKSTSGIEWKIVELKGTRAKWFIDKNKEIYFSDIINKGLNQLTEYIHTSEKYQSNLRDQHRLIDFKNPEGLLIAGRRSEIPDGSRKQALYGQWRSMLKAKIQIITYDRFADLLRGRVSDINAQKKGNPFPKHPPKGL